MMQPGQKKSHGGFTLIEVLVTLVILAVGLLGIASLQLKGAQFNHDAVLRSQISTLAYDIADRVRLAGSTLASNYTGSYTVGSARPSCTQSLYVTTAADVADDLDCWHQAVFDLLPPGSRAILSFNSGTLTVQLGWTDRESNARLIDFEFML